ncbi:MAG: molecular chaperone HtpG [Caldilineaceae bacterium]|nr:molecular chaperone HtpG [Caldilineaceae bacterium]
MNVQDTTQPESLEYRTEVKQLLDILAHSLYTDREIFLRELISNASDALNRLQFEMLTNPDVVDADAELAIWIEVDAEAKTLVLRDSGIGMNREELIANLGTIAHSGAKSFLQNAGKGQTALEEIIGQFGVGFYSVFMVAEEVRVVSRSYRAEDHAWAWTSKGDSSFTLETVEEAPRGTSIQIQLKEDATEFANGWRIEQIVKKHSDYVSFPIYLVEMEAPEQEVGDEEATETKGAEKQAKEPRVINRRTAIWRQSPSKVQAEEYNDFYKQLTFDTNDPLLHVHMVADAPVNVRALLFVPSKRERGMLQMRPDHGLRLYSRKILIQNNNKDLLPDHYRFIDGVVDSDDLPLNVSREMVQSNPVMRQLKRALTNRINRALKELADEQPEKYLTFWEEFGVFIKEGVATDHANQEALTELLRFRSSKSDGKWISLADYVGRMKADQAEIYFVLGEDLKSAARSPHLDYFRKHEIEVLYLVDPIDGWTMAMLREANGKPLRNIDDAGLELPQDESATVDENTPALDQSAFDQLVARAVEILGDKVRGVQEGKQLVDSPVRLVSPADSFDRDIQRVLRLTEEGYETPKKLLELNRRHPMIVNLGQMVARGADEPLVEAAILQLFDNALLLEGLHANPVDMVERIQLLMAEAVAARAKGE